MNATSLLTNTGRVLIIFDDTGVPEPVHRDHGDPDHHQEFIWFRPNKVKRFYIYDRAKKQKKFVDSYSCWFDTRHYHGTDPVEGMSISVRVDGVFTPELRNIIREYKGLVPPQDLTIFEKIRRRFFKVSQKLYSSNRDLAVCQGSCRAHLRGDL